MDKVLNRIRLIEVKKETHVIHFKDLISVYHQNISLCQHQFNKFIKGFLTKHFGVSVKKKSKSVVKKLSSTSNILTKAHVS